MGIEIIAIIISSAIILPIALSMLFNASFNRLADSVFYEQNDLDTDFNINNEVSALYYEAVAQTGSLLEGKRIVSVSIVMDNSQGVTDGNISVGIYSIDATSWTLEELFDTMPVTDIPAIPTTFQYNTDYVMDSDDAVAVVGSGFNNIAGEFVELHATDLNPILDTNIMANRANAWENFPDYDMRAIMIEAVEVEDTEFVSIIGILVIVALIILILIMIRSRLN